MRGSQPEADPLRAWEGSCSTLAGGRDGVISTRAHKENLKVNHLRHKILDAAQKHVPASHAPPEDRGGRGAGKGAEPRGPKAPDGKAAQD